MTKYIKIPMVGEVLKQEFMEPFELSANALAKVIYVPANRISEIVRGNRSVTAETDLKLTKYFGLTKGYFLRLQDEFLLMEAERNLKQELDAIVPRAA